MKCFVDTGAFVALYDKGDQFHQEALAIQQLLHRERAVLYTSRDVIVEVIILLRRRAGFQIAKICGNDLWNSSVLEILRPESHHDLAAWDIFESHADKVLSFVDCVSFALMKELRLRQAFTFDKNFAQFGFEPLRP